MSGAVDISWFSLLLAFVFIALAGVASLRLKLKLGRDLLWGSVRTVSQLFLMGFALRYIFEINTWYLVLGIYVVMIFFAARIVKGRVNEQTVGVFQPVFISMMLGYLVIAWFVVAIIVDAQPWYDARYFLPLGGMIIGNSMSAIAISLERLLGDLRRHRDEIELHFCLGADYRQASAEIFRNAIKAGMIPSITAMMGVGVVFIPGMMTGQILAGADPMAAVKYQIVVMLMLVGSTAAGSIITALMIRKQCFHDERLVLR